MRPGTRTFYELAVRSAVRAIASGLEEALDLGALARQAALAPLHFHHVFRGMVGETPLELHRRLRLERAARQLLDLDDPVTQVAFGAGYETHEAFTRAFRQAYGAAPSELRARARAAASSCQRTPATELTARSGVHFDAGPCPDPWFPPAEGARAMNVVIEQQQELTVAALRHVGPYGTISEAFGRLGGLAGPAGLFSLPDTAMIGLYHDDPEATPPAELRSDAGLVVPAGTLIPSGLTEVRIPAGRYARARHEGSYSTLGDAWARLMGEWLPRSGERAAAAPCFELYRNDPSDTPSEELVTDLYVPLT
jgi:AraC family transcriptional regulator